MSQRRQDRLDRHGDGAVIDIAKRRGRHENLALGEAEHEREFPLAENHHQRIRNRSDLQAGEMERREVPPVRQLKGDDVSLAYAAPRQPDSDLVGEAIEVPVGQTKLFALFRAGCDHRRLVAERIDVVTEMVEQRLVAPQSGFDHGLPADRKPDILSHSEPPQNGVRHAF